MLVQSVLVLSGFSKRLFLVFENHINESVLAPLDVRVCKIINPNI
ncbi:hypothetical protein BH23BAC3_BH23BAC3_02860 [soil metagenome]